MRASQLMFRGGLAALVALTAACNAILGVNDVAEEPPVGVDAGVDTHLCDVAPDFTLITDMGKPLTLSGQVGKNVVLYFFPKADTPG